MYAASFYINIVTSYIKSFVWKDTSNTSHKFYKRRRILLHFTMPSPYAPILTNKIYARNKFYNIQVYIKNNTSIITLVSPNNKVITLYGIVLKVKYSLANLYIV